MASNNIGDDEEDEVYSSAMQLANTTVLPMVMRAVLNLNVFEIINGASTVQISASEIASQLPNNRNPDAQAVLDRMLRVLVSHSVLTCSVVADKESGQLQRLYGLTPPCKYFIKNQDGASLSPYFLGSVHKDILATWYGLEDAVLEGGVSSEKVNEMAEYEHIAMDPKLESLFNTSMSDHSNIIMTKIMEKYKGFEGVEVVVDIGGGNGTSINLIVSKYPTIKGINFDLPHVVAKAPSYPGVEHVGGDMFVSVPKGDVIFMKWVLHNWDDEHCLRLLKKCYEALPKGGKVIVIEGILPRVPNLDNATKNMLALDMLMMVSFGAKERTKEEFEALAKGSGFIGIRLPCNAYDLWIMEFLK
ncbi:hypothetical protein Sjap_005086 [Stephania japonica]|uniref:Uncharacterized protein n=1 Tax=Stephania japonica TaxID=461633 RepID=A0AAP0K3E3_9MAGN|nr:COMT protein [Stephania japonica]